MSTTKTFVIETGKSIPGEKSNKKILLFFYAEGVITRNKRVMQFSKYQSSASEFNFVELIAKQNSGIYDRKDLPKYHNGVNQEEIIKAFEENDNCLDLIFCYDTDRENGYLFLGLWRDGVV